MSKHRGYSKFGLSAMIGNKNRASERSLPKLKELNPDEWLNIPLPLVECIKVLKKELIEKGLLALHNQMAIKNLDEKVRNDLYLMQHKIDQIYEQVDQMNDKVTETI